MKDISLHILDIVQNSIVAESSLIEISVEEDNTNDKLRLRIIDNGKGMSSEMLNSVTDPYTTTRTTRKVGMGIPLLRLNAERTGGCLTIFSELSKGTTIAAEFNSAHIDCIPLGDTAGVVVLLVSGNPNVDFIYNHKKNGNLYSFNTMEVREILEEVSIADPNISRYMKELIQINLEELKINTLGY